MIVSFTKCYVGSRWHYTSIFINSGGYMHQYCMCVETKKLSEASVPVGVILNVTFHRIYQTTAYSICVVCIINSKCQWTKRNQDIRYIFHTHNVRCYSIKLRCWQSYKAQTEHFVGEIWKKCYKMWHCPVVSCPVFKYNIWSLGLTSIEII